MTQPGWHPESFDEIKTKFPVDDGGRLDSLTTRDSVRGLCEDFKPCVLFSSTAPLGLSSSHYRKVVCRRHLIFESLILELPHDLVPNVFLLVDLDWPWEARDAGQAKFRTVTKSKN